MSPMYIDVSLQVYINVTHLHFPQEPLAWPATPLFTLKKKTISTSLIFCYFISIQADPHILATRRSSQLRKYCHRCITVNIPLAGGRTLTPGFSYFKGPHFLDESKQFRAKDVGLHNTLSKLLSSAEKGVTSEGKFGMGLTTSRCNSYHFAEYHKKFRSDSLKISLLC
jgi:hypothetical protein